MCTDRISFKFPSACQSELGPATVYLLLCVELTDLVATPPGSTLCRDSRTRHL